MAAHRRNGRPQSHATSRIEWHSGRGPSSLPTLLEHRRTPHLDHDAHLSRRPNDRGHPHPLAIDHEPQFPPEGIRRDFACCGQHVIALLLPKLEAVRQFLWRAVPKLLLVTHHVAMRCNSRAVPLHRT